jgi:hypothetical protein
MVVPVCRIRIFAAQNSKYHEFYSQSLHASRGFLSADTVILEGASGIAKWDLGIKFNTVTSILMIGCG